MFLLRLNNFGRHKELLGGCLGNQNKLSPLTNCLINISEQAAVKLNDGSFRFIHIPIIVLMGSIIFCNSDVGVMNALVLE
jgi:hypothetical protein